MKLLFDENLSPRLAFSVGKDYPGSKHVGELDLSHRDDSEIWLPAKLNGFTIVSKDSDFYDRSLLYGAPPKVIWLKVGNCSTTSIEQLFFGVAPLLGAFLA
jgi:predicted nuclease of predicted toxin-antitoxin system